MSNLKQARLDCGYRLTYVTEKTGIAFGYVSELERQEHTNPSIKVARALSRLYGKSIDELFPEHDQPE